MQTDAGMFHGNSNTMSNNSVGDIFSEMINRLFVTIQLCKKSNLPSIYTVIAFLENSVITTLQKVLWVGNTEFGSRLRSSRTGFSPRRMSGEMIKYQVLFQISWGKKKQPSPIIHLPNPSSTQKPTSNSSDSESCCLILCPDLTHAFLSLRFNDPSL